MLQVQVLPGAPSYHIKTSMQNSRKIVLISSILIAVLGFAVYANSLGGKFVWDDEVLITYNSYLKNWSNVSKFFTQDIGAGAGKKFYSYRPLQMISYLADYSLWKLNVKGYHLTNIFLHILAALGIYSLLNALYKDQILSLFTAMLFVVHPVHTEAVAYISGRADPLAVIFMFLCFILYIKHLDKKGPAVYIFMMLSYILALLARENSLILPLLLLLYHYTFRKKINIKAFTSITIVAVAFIFIRLIALKSLIFHGGRPLTLMQRLPGFFIALANYTRLLFLPFGLHMEYQKRLFSFNDFRMLAGVLILCFLLIYIFRKRKPRGIVFFSLSWFLITLLPVSNVIYPISAYMAEHWLYLPSIGFFIILAKGASYLWHRGREWRVLGVIFLAGLMAFYSVLTIRQNDYWKEPLTFYERTLRYVPDSPRIYNNLANIYRDMGRQQEAIRLYKAAIALFPDPISYNNLGELYQKMGRNKEAIALYKKALALDPNYAVTYFNLSAIYFQTAQYDLAVEYCDKAIQRGYRVNPNFLKNLAPYRKEIQ